jgi:hypothetical protein
MREVTQRPREFPQGGYLASSFIDNSAFPVERNLLSRKREN